jgi:hypothetical protein
MQIDIENASKEELKAWFLSQTQFVSELQNQLTHTTEKYEAQVNLLESKLSDSESKIISLEQRIKWYESQYFGSKSEKLIPQDPRQSSFFDVPEEPPAASVTVRGFERACRRNPIDTSEENTLRFGENVPVDEEIVYPEEVEGLSEDEYEIIGEKITERLVQTPCQFRVKRTVRKTIKIKETKTLHTAPAPYPALFIRLRYESGECLILLVLCAFFRATVCRGTSRSKKGAKCQ